MSRCGPLISYYTIKDNIWHGAALVVGLFRQRSPLLPAKNYILYLTSRS